MRCFSLGRLLLPAGLCFYGSSAPVWNKNQLRNSRQLPSEPQLISKLLELYPEKESFVPISRWVQTFSEEILEALVPYGGLGAFVAAQSNFFMVRSENGVKVVSLSKMGSELCIEKRNKERLALKRNERFNSRSAGGFKGGNKR